MVHLAHFYSSHCWPTECHAAVEGFEDGFDEDGQPHVWISLGAAVRCCHFARTLVKREIRINNNTLVSIVDWIEEPNRVNIRYRRFY